MYTRIVALALLAGTLSLGGAGLLAADESCKGLAVGDHMPEATLPMLGGGTRRVSELAGDRATLFYFLATH